MLAETWISKDSYHEAGGDKPLILTLSCSLVTFIAGVTLTGVSGPLLCYDETSSRFESVLKLEDDVMGSPRHRLTYQSRWFLREMHVALPCLF